MARGLDFLSRNTHIPSVNHICAGKFSGRHILLNHPPTTTMAPRSSITSRARNATQHPGLIVEQDKKKRRTKEEVQAECQAKEDAKEEKARTKAVGIKHVVLWKIISYL
jgi:hypothetical protein